MLGTFYHFAFKPCAAITAMIALILAFSAYDWLTFYDMRGATGWAVVLRIVIYRQVWMVFNERAYDFIDFF